MSDKNGLILQLQEPTIFIVGKFSDLIVDPVKMCVALSDHEKL